MPGVTATRRPASAWSFSMRTLASSYVLTTPPMAKLTRSLGHHDLVFVFLQTQFPRSLTNWATLLSHPASGAQKRLANHFFWTLQFRELLNISVFDSGGSDCPGLPSFQRQPDFNQAEQQHLRSLWRDGVLADEGNPCRFANRCLKHELPDEL